MKKTELKQIIREEIRKFLKEEKFNVYYGKEIVNINSFDSKKEAQEWLDDYKKSIISITPKIYRTPQAIARLDKMIIKKIS